MRAGREMRAESDQAIALLERAVDALVELDRAGACADELADLLVAVHRQHSRLGAVQLELTCGLEAAGGLEGFKDVQHFLQEALRQAPGKARRQVNTARRVARDLPGTRQALEDGEISPEHAEAIAATADELPADRVPDAEEELLGLARRGGAHNVRRQGRRLSQAADAEAARRKAQRAYEQRTLTLRDDGAGSTFIEGRLHQLGAEMLRAALSPLTAPDGRDDTRTYGQRMADALVQLAERAQRGGGAPTQEGGLPVHVLVTVPVTEIDVRAGVPTGATQGALGGELAWSGPALPPTFEQLVCDAQLEWLITDPAGEPLRYGRAKRDATRAQRRTLHQMYGGCAWPECTAPPAWTLIHHEPPFDDGGRTDVDTMVPLCHRHHTLRHHGRWHLELAPEGTVTVTSPSGERDSQSAERAREIHGLRTDVGDEGDEVAQPTLLRETRGRYRAPPDRADRRAPPDRGDIVATVHLGREVVRPVTVRTRAALARVAGSRTSDLANGRAWAGHR